MEKVLFCRDFAFFCNRRFLILLWGMAILLLVLQWFIAYHIYFFAGWDPGIVVGNAYYIAAGEQKVGDFWYYSQYTNQIMVTAVLAWIQELPCFLGYDTLAYFACILVDCGLVNLAGFFTALSLCNSFTCFYTVCCSCGDFSLDRSSLYRHIQYSISISGVLSLFESPGGRIKKAGTAFMVFNRSVWQVWHDD